MKAGGGGSCSVRGGENNESCTSTFLPLSLSRMLFPIVKAAGTSARDHLLHRFRCSEEEEARSR